MPTDKLNNDNKFDETLAQALRGHSAPAPAGFTERMLKQIKEAEEQAILARVVWQKRVALAGSIILAVAAIVAAVVFPDSVAGVFRGIAGGFTEESSALVDRIGQAVSIEAIRSKWQFYTIFALVLGFAVYSFVDMLVGDRLRTA